jgi:2-polyprenyl-3-methyl-5-hydroxy-6-metoxy-1,4-benzoquinol methylase
VAAPRHLTPEEFAPLLQDLGLAAQDLRVVDPAPPPGDRKVVRQEPGSVLLGQIGTGLDIPHAAAMYRRLADPLLVPDGWALLYFKDARGPRELARWRNALWPWLHAHAWYHVGGGRIERETLAGRTPIAGSVPREGVLLAARRREHALSPSTTVEKFDSNAAGWNGEPGRPGYAHHRWMRRYVGLFARPAAGARVLDFGCGAGWVGIEAARSAANCSLRAFDPSPEMVRIAGENARASGVADFEGRTGFGEAPPYPAAGEEGFDVVYSSGVISFSPDHERWLEGLVRAVRPGGVLVVGDIQRESRGMRRRRAERPLLPVREMNARTGDEVRARLEARGFRCEAQAGYQLTWPVPQLAHASDAKLGGALSPLFLAANRALAGKLDASRYDSWVLRLRAPGA